MTTIAQQIVERIQSERISATAVADCLNKGHALQGVGSINRRQFAVGPAFWCYAFDQSNWTMHEQIQDAPAGSVVIIDTIECEGRAAAGALVCDFLLRHRKVAAVVATGPVRDLPDLIERQLPVWSGGTTPLGCYNTRQTRKPSASVLDPRRVYFESSIAVCDDSGVVVIPRAFQTENFLEALTKIQEQERIWAECIGLRKWSTFDTVCLKKYDLTGR